MSDQGWEARMSQRAQARLRAAEEQQAAERDEAHYHEGMSACRCGIEDGGLTCYVATEDAALCDVCGKPRAQWGDGQQAREVDEHADWCRMSPGFSLEVGGAWSASSNVTIRGPLE